ncbi:MAG: glucosamine-6-phosphate deaminase [Kiritimatiellae bacterium]|jgi:glucosamine-6-phosphate deaminase|nr:glucosamine-6-phosphate deaminase [Kiritimatiellia bacterium]
MNIQIYKSNQEAAVAAGEYINSYVRNNPKAVLGLATGSTPLPLYAKMVKACKNGLDYSGVTTFNLDEYVGLPIDQEQSYRAFMNKNLFSHLNIDINNTFVPDGMAQDLEAQCAEYEERIKAAGGIDIQVLGIGSNGHIGFNEPPAPFDSRTSVIDLTEQTISDNARFFESAADVPKRAISMGVGTILDARACILLSFGTGKAKALKGAIEESPDVMNPASALQNHPNITFYVDEASASYLTKQHKT